MEVLEYFDKGGSNNDNAESGNGGRFTPAMHKGNITPINPGNLDTWDMGDLANYVGGNGESPSYITPAEAEALGQISTEEKNLLKSTQEAQRHISTIAKTRTSALKSILKARTDLLKQNEAQYGLYVTYLRQVYNSGVMLHAMNTRLETIFKAAEARMAVNRAGQERASAALEQWSQKLARR